MLKLNEQNTDKCDINYVPGCVDLFILPEREPQASGFLSSIVVEEENPIVFVSFWLLHELVEAVGTWFADTVGVTPHAGGFSFPIVLDGATPIVNVIFWELSELVEALEK